MSKAMRERRIMAPPVGVLTIALLLVVALAGSRFGQTNAQDASPAASPVSGDCVAATGTADAAVADADADAATPEAAPVGTPVDETTADAAIAAATNFVNCFNAGEWESALTLVTPNYLETTFGTTDVDALASLLEESVAAGQVLSPLTLVSADAGSVATYDDGRASIDLAYMQGDYQYVAATWYMVMAGDDLLIDEEDLGGLAPEGDSVIISASVADDVSPVVFDQRSEVTESEVLTIHLVNLAATTDAFYSVYSVPAAADTGTPLAEGEVAATPTGDEAMMGELVGTTTVAAGGEEDMHLLNLPAGTYVLVNPLVEGSVATLTVTSLDI